MIFTKFLVVDVSSVYNIIIGHPTLNALRAIEYINHLTLKFQTTIRIDVVQGNQVEVHHCYALAMKEKKNNPQKPTPLITHPKHYKLLCLPSVNLQKG